MAISDTTPEAERTLVNVLRELPFETRWRQIGAMFRQARQFHAAGYRMRHPGAAPAEIAADWRKSLLGDACGAGEVDSSMNIPDDSSVLVEVVVKVLDRLGIAYAVGGSWASSIYGYRRFTADADLTVEPFPGREAEFFQALGADLTTSLEAIKNAVRRRSTFNIIHSLSGFKVDVFVRKDRPFDRQLIPRRQMHRLLEDSGPNVYVVAPEDIILLKLEWYRLGGEISEKQWNDILGVFKVQGDALDQSYLDNWSQQLGVQDLLQRARQDSVL